MTESELDVLWQRALHEAVAAGEPFTRYRFAALVRAQVIEEAAKVCEALAADSRQHPLCQAMGEACAARIREPDSGHSTARAGEASTTPAKEPRVTKGMVNTLAASLEDLAALSRSIQEITEKYGLETSPPGWIPVSERLPEIGTECLVFKTSPWVDGPYIAFDRWDEQYEAPVSFSSATISVGVGWGEADFNEVTHWMPLPAAPTGADNVSPGSNVQAESASPSVLLIRGEK